MPPGTRALARSLRAVALLVLCLAGAPSHAKGQTIEPGGPISIDPDAAPDSAILDRVEAILDAIAVYGGVEAQVRAGVVRLDGGPRLQNLGPPSTRAKTDFLSQPAPEGPCDLLGQ